MSLLGLPVSKGMLIGVAGLLLVLAAESGWIVGQARSIGQLEEQNRGLRHELAQGSLDLKSCERTRDSLRGSLERCISEVEIAKDESAQARQSIDELTAHIRRETEGINRERVLLFRATPSCYELAHLDLDGACPGIAGSLRERAARMSAAREGTNANPGTP